MPATNYGMAEILQAFFGTQVTVPTTWYVGLATTVFTSETIDGSDCNEVSGGSYARESITNNAGDNTDWVTAAHDSILTSNQAAITFTESSAIWDTVTTVFLADASTDGNIYFYTNITPTLYVGTDTIISWAANTLQVTMS